MDWIVSTLLGCAVIATAAGCAPRDLSTPAPTSKSPYTMPPPTPTISAIASVGPAPHGRPYTAAMITGALESAPPSLPGQLRSGFIANVLADRIWTYDGRPYRDLGISGSCDDTGDRCEITAIGLPAFAPTTDSFDTYHITVRVGAELVLPEGLALLRGYPPDLAAGLDRLARSLDRDGRFVDMVFWSAAWVLPPPEDAFLLRYQRGDLEGAEILYVTIDRSRGQIIGIEKQAP